MAPKSSSEPDQQQQPPAGEPGGQADSSKTKTGGPSVDELRPMVTRIVEDALKPVIDRLNATGSSSSGDSSGQAAPAGQPPDIAKMVDEGIAKVIADRDNTAKEHAHAEAHKQLAAAAERRPQQRPRRSGWLGDIWDR